MKCPNCSESLPTEALFCGACGQAVAPPVLAPAQLRPFIEPPQAIRPLQKPAEPDAGGDADGGGDPGGERSTCDECGAALSPTDIFCGGCGRVSPTVSAAFSSVRDTSAIGSLRPAVPERPPMAASAPNPATAGTTGDRFVLQFSTGESVTVSGTGLIGRNPLSEPGEYFDHLVRVLDSTRSVSKTHLEFGQQAGAFWISDRYSGNGTIVREPDRPGIRCEPGRRHIVVRGARVVIGEQFFIVS